MKTPVVIGMHLRGRPGFVRRGPASALPASNALAIPDLPINQAAWNPILITLCDMYNSANFSFEKLVSHKTRDERRRFLFTFFKELRRDPERSFRIDPRQLGDRHVQWAFKRWVERGLAPATIQTYLSFLRVFELWIGKPGMVKRAEVYARQLSLPADTVQRNTVATEDRGWDDASSPIAQTLRKVADLDPWVGAQLRLQAAFGARVKESICFRPRIDATDASVTFDRGTKGGRKREVRIETDAQRAALAHAQALVQREDAPLADPGRTLKQNHWRFYNVLKTVGVTRSGLGKTAHGLRHTYAGDKYESLTGTQPPIRGGETVDTETDSAARLRIARELGHARKSVSSAYLGGVLRARAASAVKAEANDDH